MNILTLPQRARTAHCAPRRNFELFFSMPPWWQSRRIRELRASGLSEDLVVSLTRRGIGAVREAMEARS